MKLLILGDIVGKKTIEYLKKNLWQTRSERKDDFVIANGENASDIHGISAGDAAALLDCGIDVITTGNHVFKKRDIYPYIENSTKMIRPANYPSSAPGSGSTITDVNGYKVLIMNVLGTTYMEPLGSPFEAVDKILAREEGRYDLSVLDVHAEATSEKLALARYFDGRINVIFGTHTHVTTADECIMQKGSAYITDVGMSGPVNSILGASCECILEKFTTHMPVNITCADGKIEVHAIEVEIDPESKKVRSVKRLVF